jgi:hypothetical protein
VPTGGIKEFYICTASGEKVEKWQERYYSEQQNCSTKGQISLVSQIVAQRTKGKSWENHETKEYM